MTVFQRAGHELMHRLGVIAFDEVAASIRTRG